LRDALAVLAQDGHKHQIGRAHVPGRRDVRRRMVRVELEPNPGFRVVSREPSASTHSVKYMGSLPQLPTGAILGRSFVAWCVPSTLDRGDLAVDAMANVTALTLSIV
jgi:hypothetical protein